jgi:phosphate transport system permease protein
MRSAATRRRAERRVRLLARLAAFTSAALVALIVGGLAWRGLAAFDWPLLTRPDSVDAGRAGIAGALRGSLLSLGVALGVATPLGVAVALWLEEFAAPRRWTALVELLVNNLAAVPPIIWGLLGLALLIDAGGLPRSAPLVAGLTLALMTMPTVVVTGRAALTAVPSDVREAARGLGASPVQVAFHHVLPLAAPGMVTGVLFAAARALGEAAPLLLLGMAAFIPAAAGGLDDPATALPVQVLLWTGQVDPAFAGRAAAAILVLLVLLLAITAAAAGLRTVLERRR